MKEVSIRDLMHNFSSYLKDVKSGECVTVLERNRPIVDIVPHNPDIRYPGWKRVLAKRVIAGESFSESVEKARENE